MRYLTVAALLLLPLGVAQAQDRGGTELGVGLTALGLDISNGTGVFSLAANQRYIQAGFYLSPTLAIAPWTAISVASGGGASVTAVTLGVDVPIFAKQTWGHSGVYFAPGAQVSILNESISGLLTSANQFFLGFALGDKLKISDPVSLDFSGHVGYGFSNSTVPDVISINAQMGLSVFFR